jgi:hypothetical protein
MVIFSLVEPSSPTPNWVPEAVALSLVMLLLIAAAVVDSSVGATSFLQPVNTLILPSINKADTNFSFFMFFEFCLNK